jgi:hypothetical protein
MAGPIDCLKIPALYTLHSVQYTIVYINKREKWAGKQLLKSRATLLWLLEN